MYLQLIHNPDERQIIIYKLARIIYAETYGKTLRVVEALASMIQNYVNANACEYENIINDSNFFECLDEKSEHHSALNVDASSRPFEMCVRVVRRMINGGLPDMCFGATRFHRTELLPKWSIARGYIADIDGLLFYL